MALPPKKRFENKYVVASAGAAPPAPFYAPQVPMLPLAFVPAKATPRNAPRSPPKRMSAIEPLLLELLYSKGPQGLTVEEAWIALTKIYKVQGAGTTTGKSGRSSISAIAMKLIDQKQVKRAWEYYYPMTKTGEQMTSLVRRHRYYAAQFAPAAANFY